jgi:hypothetical protein
MNMRTVQMLVALLVLSWPVTSFAGDLAIPQFVEETGISGVSSVYEGEWEYMVGGGVAAFDCNGDGFADMLLAGGSAPAKFYRNTAKKGGPLSFQLKQSGLELDAVTGAYPLDIDSDGNMDLVLLRVGENVVMRGLGECRFEPANEAWNFDGGDAWSAAMAATFEKGASWPTIAIGNYIDRREEMFPWGSCTDNWLHRPGESGKFAAPLPLAPSFCALSMLFTDWDRSGMPALRVSNDREYYKGGQEQLWHVEPGKPPVLYTEAEGWKPLRIWGMGIAGHDIDLDGYPEYFHTSMADNKLQKLAPFAAGQKPKPEYTDIAYVRGVTAHRPFMGEDLKPSTAWHTQFEDFNNDGLVDLFIAKGNVAKMPDFAARDPNNMLLQGADGKFVEVADKAGTASGAISRGAAIVDFNMDGLLDIVVVNRWENAQLWRNASTGAGRWLQIALRQDGHNRYAIGSWIEVRRDSSVQRREITVGGGHASGQSGWQHFGLGDFGRADVRVIWPDGEPGEWQTLPAGKFHVIERGKPPVEWVTGEAVR